MTTSSPGDHPGVLGVAYGAITIVITIAALGIARRDVLPLLTYRPTPATIDSTTIAVRSGGAPDRYTPRVYFTYSVAGRVYHGTRVTPGDLRGKQPWAEDLAARFRPGTNGTAYFNPVQPDRAFLYHAVDTYWGLLAMFAVWLGVAAFVVIRAVRKGRPRTRGEAA